MDYIVLEAPLSSDVKSYQLQAFQPERHRLLTKLPVCQSRPHWTQSALNYLAYCRTVFLEVSPQCLPKIQFAGHLFLTAQGRVDLNAAWLAIQHAVFLVPRINIDLTCVSMEPLKHLRTVPANTQDSRQPPQPYTQSKAVTHHMITFGLTRTAGSGPKVSDHPVMS